jgi:cobalamin biosynthesis protein CbiD
MTKTEKISIEALEEAAKKTYTTVETVAWNGVEVAVKKALSLEEMMGFVDGVTKSCFALDGGAYLPEVKDFAIKSGLIEAYTNIGLPEDAGRQYNLIYSSDIIQAILEHINRWQFDEMIQAINDKVENLAQANIEMVNRQVNELYAAFDNLQTRLSDVFSGIGAGDIAKLVGAVANGGLDEEKLVGAYIRQIRPDTEPEAVPEGGGA